MDLEAIIRELREEKQIVDRLIASLEEMEAGSAATAGLLRRRGRKSMSPEERRAVSERMKRYWAKRRKC